MEPTLVLRACLRQCGFGDFAGLVGIPLLEGSARLHHGRSVRQLDDLGVEHLRRRRRGFGDDSLWPFQRRPHLTADVLLLMAGYQQPEATRQGPNPRHCGEP